MSLNCTITLTNPIGPDISSLTIEWFKSEEMIQDYISQKVPLPSSVFTSSLALTRVSSSDTGVYNCTASIEGSTNKPITGSLALCLEGKPKL